MLGTFNIEIKATKAYDRVVFKLHGSKATLNFPLEVENSSSKFNVTDVEAEVSVGRKRRKESKSESEDRKEMKKEVMAQSVSL